MKNEVRVALIIILMVLCVVIIIIDRNERIKAYSPIEFLVKYEVTYFNGDSEITYATIQRWGSREPKSYLKNEGCLVLDSGRKRYNVLCSVRKFKILETKNLNEENE